MKQEYVTTLNQLRYWEERARKGDRALMALSRDIRDCQAASFEVRTIAAISHDIRDYLATAPEVRATERDGILIIKKLRSPLRPKHEPKSTISSPISQGSAKLSGGNGLLVKYQPPQIKPQR